MRRNILQLPNDDINFFNTISSLTCRFQLSPTDELQINSLLENLKFNKCPGYDNITPKMLVMRKTLLSNILKTMFNKMIIEATYPNALKVHRVIPIPKSKGINNIANYRPVSVLPIIDKIFERILYDQLINYLDNNNILYDRQFGFKKGIGTDEAIVNVVDYICEGIDIGYKGVAGVFYDLSKAFDLVDHDILIRKLEFLGFSISAIGVFQNYLKNRKQFVQVDKSKSIMLDVLCGVPQGSVLGPLLFKIYINDMKNINFFGKLTMYADDICLLYNYKYDEVLKTQIEYDAAILSEYLRLNRLVLNAEKTKFIRFKPSVLRNDQTMKVHINGKLIEESENVKYLGLYINHNLTWENHICKLKSKVSSAIGILYKFKNKLNTKTKMLLYNSLIHSHLTYLPMIYGFKPNAIRTLQSAQNKALKIVFNLPLRFSTLCLYRNVAITTLPIRGLYKQQLILYIFKCVRGYGVHSMQFHQNHHYSSRATRQATDLNVVRCRLELTKQKITYSGPNEYNELPSNLKNILLLSTFKINLKRHLLNNVEMLLTS